MSIFNEQEITQISISREMLIIYNGFPTFSQGVAQTFFAEPALQLYAPGAKFSPSQLLVVEIAGKAQLTIGLILYLLHWHSLLNSLSYALVVDAIYDGHLLVNHSDILGRHKTNLAMSVLIKAICSVLGFNAGFGKINPAYIIKAFSVSWVVIGLFGTLFPSQLLKSLGTLLTIWPYHLCKDGIVFNLWR